MSARASTKKSTGSRAPLRSSGLRAWQDKTTRRAAAGKAAARDRGSAASPRDGPSSSRTAASSSRASSACCPSTTTAPGARPASAAKASSCASTAMSASAPRSCASRDAERSFAPTPSSQREQWLRLPWRLYKDYPGWVPNLLMLQRDTINVKKNPFFDHGEAQLFLAMRDGQPVGRISAQVDTRHNEQHNERTGFFGFFEAEDDPSIAAALLGAAEAWVRERNLDVIRGPYNLALDEELGMQIEGFDQPAMIQMPQTQPYYPAMLDAPRLHEGDGPAGLSLGHHRPAGAHDGGGREDARRARPHAAPDQHGQAAPGGRPPARYLHGRLERDLGLRAGIAPPGPQARGRPAPDRRPVAGHVRGGRRRDGRHGRRPAQPQRGDP